MTQPADVIMANRFAIVIDEYEIAVFAELTSWQERKAQTAYGYPEARCEREPRIVVMARGRVPGHYGSGAQKLLPYHA
jgi:hypothetical protein